MALIALLVSALVAIIDQVIKYFVSTYLPTAGNVEVIPSFLSLTYLENRGVAFGMFSDMRWFFIIITSAVIVLLVYIISTRKINSKLFLFGSALVVGGGIGNLIDRVFLGYVVDYLQLSFFPPVCNFADYCVTVGTVMIVVYLLFFSDKLKITKAENKNKEIKND